MFHVHVLKTPQNEYDKLTPLVVVRQKVRNIHSSQQKTVTVKTISYQAKVALLANITAFKPLTLASSNLASSVWAHLNLMPQKGSVSKQCFVDHNPVNSHLLLNI